MSKDHTLSESEAVSPVLAEPQPVHSDVTLNTVLGAVCAAAVVPNAPRPPSAICIAVPEVTTSYLISSFSSRRVPSLAGVPTNPVELDTVMSASSRVLFIVTVNFVEITVSGSPAHRPALQPEPET